MNEVIAIVEVAHLYLSFQCL